MAFIFGAEYFEVGPKGISQAQTMAAYLGGSAFQTVMDNPVTAYRQLVQQYAKDIAGNTVAPEVALAEANKSFKANPLGACLSGVRHPRHDPLLGGAAEYAVRARSAHLGRGTCSAISLPHTRARVHTHTHTHTDTRTLGYARAHAPRVRRLLHYPCFGTRLGRPLISAVLSCSLPHSA